MHDRATVEQQTFHGRIEDQREVMRDAELRDEAPVGSIEIGARRHGRRHQEHGPRFRGDSAAQRATVQRPGRSRRKVQPRETRNAAREPHAVNQAGVSRIGDDHLVPDLDGGQQHVEDAREPAGRDDAIALARVRHAEQNIRDAVAVRRV